MTTHTLAEPLSLQFFSHLTNAIKNTVIHFWGLLDIVRQLNNGTLYISIRKK